MCNCPSFQHRLENEQEVSFDITTFLQKSGIMRLCPDTSYVTDVSGECDRFRAPLLGATAAATD